MAHQTDRIYENVVVELYNADRVHQSVRSELEDLLQDRYVEKYTRPVMKSSEPFMNIRFDENMVSLFDDEIKIDNITKVLEENSKL